MPGCLSGSRNRGALWLPWIDISGLPGPSNRAMAGGSNGYRAARARQLTPALISSFPGTAGSPPFISFSTSYRELLPIPRSCKGGHLTGCARFADRFPCNRERPRPVHLTRCRHDWFELRPETPQAGHKPNRLWQKWRGDSNRVNTLFDK